MRRSEYLRLFEEGLRKRGFVTEASRTEIVKELEAHMADLVARHPERSEDELLAELPTPEEMASFMADEMPGRDSQQNRFAEEGTEIPIGRGEPDDDDRRPPRQEWGSWNKWNDWEQWRDDWRKWKGNWKEWRRQWKEQWKDQWKSNFKDEWKHHWDRNWNKAWEKTRHHQGPGNQHSGHQGPGNPHGPGGAPWEKEFSAMFGAMFRDVFGPGAGHRESETDGVVDVSQVREIEIKTVSADLKLAQSDGVSLAWRVKIKAAGETAASWEPDLRFDGDRAYIDFSGGPDARTLKVAIDVPSHVTGIRIFGSSGDVKAEDIDQGLEIQTASGEVKLARCGSFARVKSSSGDISIKHALGPVEVLSESGEIEIDTAEDDLRAQTSSGDIEIGHAEGRLILESVSGDVEVKRSCCNRGGYIRTVSGEIDLRVDHDMNAAISIRSNGDIDIDHDAGIVYDDPDDPKRVRIDIGDGGEEVIVESTSGDIRVRA